MEFRSPRVRPFLTAAAVLAALLFAPGLLPAQEGPRWTPLGPWGGTPGSIAIHPTHPQTLYGSGAFSLPGVIRSTDGGASWKLLPGSPFNPLFVEIDPSRPDTMYSGRRSDGQVFRSTDGGASWQRLNVGAAGAAGSTLFVGSFGVDPAKPSRLYAGTSRGVWRSEDRGASWQRLSRGLPNGGDVGVQLYAVPGRPAGTAYLITNDKGVFFRTSDGGRRWKALRMPFRFFPALAFSPLDARTVYASFGRRGFFRSDNGGDTWVQVSQPRAELNTLAVHPRQPRTVYGGTPGSGLFKSTDGGRSWFPIGDFAEVHAHPLAVDPSSQTVYADVSGSGLLRSVDGGATWERRDFGIPGVHADSVAVDPADPEILAATSGDLFRSDDGGARFVRTNAGHPPTDPVGLARVLATEPGTFYVVDFRRPLLWKSTNSGLTWSSLPSPGASPSVQVASLRADPIDPDTLYALAEFSFQTWGMFRSLDGGVSWAFLALPSDTCEVTGFTVARPSASPSSTLAVLYLAGTRILGTNCLSAQVAAVFRSSDGGSTWTDVSAGLPRGTGLTASPVATDPLDSRVVYAGIDSQRPNAPRGLWKSTDAGATWQRTSLPRVSLLALTSSPVPGVLWAASLDGTVYRSGDAGATWEDRSGGQVLQSVRNFVFDPADPERVYAAGFGGVWVSLP